MEAAHIIDESKGGPNTEENGIPVCFDCHQEIGAYNDSHPRGNKLRPEELRAHRDRMFKLVESGTIQLRAIVSQFTQKPTAEQVAAIQGSGPSAEAKQMTELLLSDAPPDAPDRKLRLLSEMDRAYVFDRLLAEARSRPQAVESLSRVATPKLLAEDELSVVLAQLVRSVTLFGTVSCKAKLLQALSKDALASVAEYLRLALFDDVIQTVEKDQYDEVNEIVPALEEHVATLPPQLHADFVLAMLGQARSSSYQGAPVARRILKSVSPVVAKAALPRIDRKFLEWHGDEPAVRGLVTQHWQQIDPGPQRSLLEDYAKMQHRAFREKYKLDD